MKIILEKYGQLCNNMWSYVPYILDALRNNTKLYILGFDDYAKDFPYLNCCNNIQFVNICKSKSIFPFYLKLLFRLSKLSCLQRYIVHPDISKKEDYHITEEEHKKLKHIFSGSRTCSDYLNKVFENRSENDIFCGVHIRRGDYKSYQNGAWYFDDKTYNLFMIQFKQLFPKNRVKFVVVSNENVDYSKFSVDVIHTNSRSAIFDLYTLSMCDYIIGPHSTFSMWASFYGRKPLEFLYKNKNITKNAFIKVKYMNEI